MSKLALALADGAVVAKRNLIKIKRVPDILIWTSPTESSPIFPLVFLILPAFLLLTVGPVVLATVHSLRTG